VIAKTRSGEPHDGEARVSLAGGLNKHSAAAWRQGDHSMESALVDHALFLAATLAALVAGLAGSAFGLVGAAVWLHVLTPLQTALIIAFGLVVQGISVWKLRRGLQWGRLWPFLVGSAIGVPAGVAILEWASPANLRAGSACC